MGDYDLPDISQYKLPDLSGGGGGYVEPAPPKPYVRPPKPTPYEEPVDSLGFIKNLPKSVLKMTKEVFYDFPKSVLEAGYHYATAPDGTWAKDWDAFLRHPGDTGAALRRSVTDYYTDGLWRNFNDDPARALGDMAALMDGVGAVGRLGGVARAADVVGRASEAGKAGLLSNSAKFAGGVGQVTEGIGAAAKFTDPLRVLGIGAGKVFSRGLRALGYGELTPEIAELYNHINAREALVDHGATAEELAIPLTDAEKDTMSRHLNYGDPEEIAAMQAQGGNLAKRYEMRRQRVTGVEEPYIRKNKVHFGMDDPEVDFLEAKAKAVEHYTNEHPDQFPVPISRDQARDMIKDKLLDPTYNTMFRDSKGTNVDIWEMFNKERGVNKSLGRAESRIANGEYLTDIDEIVARQNRQFHNVKAKLDFLGAVKELLTSKGQILVGNGPEVIEAAKKLGYRELPDAFYKWYWENYNKGTSVLVNEMKSASKAGLNQTETIARLREAWNAALATGDMEKYAAGGKVFVPDYVAAWIGQELAPARFQVYSSWMSRYKSMATVFNPRYWAPVLFGNALVASLYGLSPDMLKLALKHRGDLPPSLRQLTQNEIWLKDLNFFDRKATSFGQAASMLDNIYRQGMFANEVLKNSYVRQKFALSKFFPAQQAMADALKYISEAPERHASALTQLGELKDAIANHIIKTDTAYKDLKRMEAKLTNELAHMMQLRQSNFSELEAGLNARKDKLGKLFGAEGANGLNPEQIKQQIADLERDTVRQWANKKMYNKLMRDAYAKAHAIATDNVSHTIDSFSEAPLEPGGGAGWINTAQNPLMGEGGQDLARTNAYYNDLKKAGFRDPIDLDQFWSRVVPMGGKRVVPDLADLKKVANTDWPINAWVTVDQMHSTQEELKRIISEIEMLNHDPNALPGATARKADLMSALGQSKINYRNVYHTQNFLDALDVLRKNLKSRAELVDPAAVLQSVDAAIQAIEKGRPDLLRYITKHMKDAVTGKSPLAQRSSRLSVFVDMVAAAEKRVAEHTAEAIDKLSQTGALEKRLPLLAKERQIAARAAEVGNKFYGSVDSLLPFERKVIKQIIPFYTFTKAMTSLAFHFPFMYPKRSFIFSHLARAWNDIMDDEEAMAPSWTKNYIPLLAHSDGTVTMIRVGSLQPFSNVRINKMGEQNFMPNVYDVLSQHPLIRIGFEMKGGIPEWSARPLSPGQKGVRMDNGEVMEWSGTGFRRTIAQPSILKTIAGLFPQSQLIDQLIHGYAQTDRGWLASPEAMQSPSGTVKYPKELLDRIASIAVPTTTVDKAQLEQRSRVEVSKVVREFQREMRTAPPDRRADLIESLRAWSQQKRRSIKTGDDY